MVNGDSEDFESFQKQLEKIGNEENVVIVIYDPNEKREGVVNVSEFLRKPE